MLASDAFATAAAVRAGATHEVRSITVSTATVAHTDVVEVTVRGASRDTIAAVAQAMPATAQAYMARAFASYEIDPLGSVVNSTSEFPPRPATVLLAFTAGLTAALAFAVLEWAATRRALGTPTPLPAGTTTVIPLR